MRPNSSLAGFNLHSPGQVEFLNWFSLGRLLFRSFMFEKWKVPVQSSRLLHISPDTTVKLVKILDPRQCPLGPLPVADTSRLLHRNELPSLLSVNASNCSVFSSSLTTMCMAACFTSLAVWCTMACVPIVLTSKVSFPFHPSFFTLLMTKTVHISDNYDSTLHCSLDGSSCSRVTDLNLICSMTQKIMNNKANYRLPPPRRLYSCCLLYTSDAAEE